LELIDIVILVVLLVPTMVGAIYGCFNIVLSIVVWVGAFGLAINYTSDFSSIFFTYIETEIIRDILSFLSIFVLCVTLFSILRHFLPKILGRGRGGLTAADRIIGLVCGFGVGSIFVVVIVFFIGFTDLIHTDWWQRSVIVRPFEQISVSGNNFLSRSAENYRNYIQSNEVNKRGG